MIRARLAGAFQAPLGRAAPGTGCTQGCARGAGCSPGPGAPPPCLVVGQRLGAQADHLQLAQDEADVAAAGRLQVQWGGWGWGRVELGGVGWSKVGLRVWLG